MRCVVRDEVESGLGGVGFADLLRSPDAAEGARLSVHHYQASCRTVCRSLPPRGRLGEVASIVGRSPLIGFFSTDSAITPPLSAHTFNIRMYVHARGPGWAE